LLADLIVTPETLDSVASIHSDPSAKLDWNLVFTLPQWLKTWWSHFGSGADLHIRSIRQGSSILGIAPFKRQGSAASIIGSTNVCDYQDLICLPGFENEFCTALLRDLAKSGIKTLEIESFRPDSQVARFLIPAAQALGCSARTSALDVSLDLALPLDYETYLASLDGKQRHEIRRKLRNLNSLGEVRYRVTKDQQEVKAGIATFLQLFPEYRLDKAEFLTGEMHNFFRDLASNLGEAGGIVRFGSLESAGKTLAMIMYFDYNNNVYLYNSAYDPAFKSLSVGIVSKVLCIRDSIENRKARFDFLKGNEQYKYYLGGKEIVLSSCLISLL
jgi:CelD/BcsL family acetyltransferase involved in cellulose biosynthesis